MDFSASGGCHQPIHQVPRRSSVSSEHSSTLRFSGFFSFIPAGARLFCVGMLVLLLTLPCPHRVGAVTFAFNGFQGSDIYMVPGSPWTFQSNTSCYYFDPPEASWNKSVAGRFLYPSLVQMKDPATKRVKSFSTTFIYQIQIPQAYSSTVPIGPGMSFIVVPDNVTVGAAEDYMGLFTADTSTSFKNYESDVHTLGVELDTFRNPEFHDPDDNHIGLNLASMNSTFIVDPGCPLYSFAESLYTQIWIDYSEADSRMDISIALYGQGKPVTPQGSRAGVDLSLLREYMFVGFSTANGIESNNVPSVCAWSFSNDGIPAPPIVFGLNETSASPSADAPLALRPSHVLRTHLHSGSRPLSLSITPRPLHTTMETVILDLVIMIMIDVSVIFLAIYLFLRRRNRVQHPLRIFISHAGGPDGSGKHFARFQHDIMTSILKSRVKIFCDRGCFEYGKIFAQRIFEELARFDVGIVVVTKEYFEGKWSMTELIAFMEAQKNDPKERIRILPLFYGFTPDELKGHLREGTWEDSWKEMVRDPHPITVEMCRDAVTWLCTRRGILYNLHNSRNDKLYMDTICKEIDDLVDIDREFRSSLGPIGWIKSTLLGRVTSMTFIGTKKRKRLANQRTRKEIEVMIYINKLLRLLFGFSGILVILLSIILDNFFNDKPIRFTAFAILAPVMISLGFLASGWCPRIPLRFIAFVKRCAFLQHVVACSPWHDNVVTDFCGKVCTLEPLEREGTRLLDFPTSVQNFLYEDQFPPQRTRLTTYSHSTLESDIQDCQVATSPLEIQFQDIGDVSTLNQAFNPQSQDFKTNNVPDQASMSEILERPHVFVATGLVSSPNLYEAPSRVEDIAVETDDSPLFYVLGDEQAPILEFEGPKINGFPLKVQAFKNTSTRALNFDLFCTFQNKKRRRMNLTTERLSNLIQNMCQWVKMPYPIVVDESSDILHCMAIQDILWAFTKGVYTFNSVRVEHRFLAGMEKGGSVVFVSLTIFSLMVSVIPLVSNKTSNWFLLFLIVPVAYVLTLLDIPYYFRSIFCPVYMKYKDFRRLYKSKSPFIWCNEFRKKKIVNPNSFWIDQEYANKLSDADSCFYTDELVILPGNPYRGKSFKIACQGWPEDDQKIYKKQHDYELEVNFDTFNPENGSISELASRCDR